MKAPPPATHYLESSLKCLVSKSIQLKLVLNMLDVGMHLIVLESSSLHIYCCSGLWNGIVYQHWAN